MMLASVAHTLELVANEGRLAWRSVAHVETVWCRIVIMSFKHRTIRSGSISGVDLKSELLIPGLR